MATIKLNILEHPKKLLLIAALGLAAAVFLHAPKASAAACSTPATNMGTVTSTTNVSTAGTYRIWSRIMSGTSATDNSYDLEIDGANCYHVGNNNSMATGSWQWIDYQNGTTSTKINLALTAGNHTIKMIGTEDGVKVDRIIMTTDTACVPTGTGDNCVSVDGTSPTASITSPTANAKLRGTVNVTATANDDSGTVTKVELYVDGGTTPVATDTSSPYSLSWNTASSGNGNHTLTVKAYDASGNVGTSAGVAVTVDNSAPTVSLTAPADGITVSGTINLTATASDNVGVTSVDFVQGLTILSSDTSSPYSYSWDTTLVKNGDYIITAIAHDAAGNTTNSVQATITINNPTPPPTDTQNPTTSITSPTGGNVSGTVTVNASASDNVGVTKVELYVDNVLAATDVASPYSFSWNTTTLTSGSHSLKTRAYDAAGNNQYSSVVTVNVNNPSANPGDVNGDGHVTIIDLSTLLTNYGGSGKTRTQGDLDGNGIVNILDLSRLLSNYGS